eukprot:4954052-Alexandrium_andersonii.AAC.1
MRGVVRHAHYSALLEAWSAAPVGPSSGPNSTAPAGRRPGEDCEGPLLSWAYLLPGRLGHGSTEDSTTHTSSSVE